MVPAANPGKCCSSMTSTTDFCDPVYTWCSYSYTGNIKYFGCPISSTCDDVVSVADNQWYKKSYYLKDGEICIMRVKYDTYHLNDAIASLAAKTGDTDYRYTHLTGNLTQEVRIRVN